MRKLLSKLILDFGKCPNQKTHKSENAGFLVLTKTLQNQNSNYITLYEKNAFGFNFGPWEVPELENMHFHFHAFSGWGTSRDKKSGLKAVFLKKSYIITVLNFFLERFGQNQKTCTFTFMCFLVGALPEVKNQF